MSCGVGYRRSSGLALLWLWHRPAARTPIRPLAWKPPYAVGAALKKKKRQKTKKKLKYSVYLSIITLNVNGLNTLIKRHWVVDWIKKKNKTYLHDAYNRLTSELKINKDISYE